MSTTTQQLKANTQEALAEETAAIIKKYHKQLHPNYDMDNLLEGLYWMLGGERWEDNIYGYELNLTAMLETMAKPGVAKVLSEHLHSSTHESIIDMFGRIINFLRELDDKMHRLVLMAYHIEGYGDNRTEEYLINMHEYYKSKIAGLKAERAAR